MGKSTSGRFKGCEFFIFGILYEVLGFSINHFANSSVVNIDSLKVLSKFLKETNQRCS
jgi:hypothetical protein